jgi:hypothetical protein
MVLASSRASSFVGVEMMTSGASLRSDLSSVLHRRDMKMWTYLETDDPPDAALTVVIPSSQYVVKVLMNP